MHTYLSLHPLETPTHKHPPGICLYHTHGLHLLCCPLTYQVTSAQGLKLNHASAGCFILLSKSPAPEEGLQALEAQQDLQQVERMN